jgi:hypothetical protein
MTYGQSRLKGLWIGEVYVRGHPLYIKHLHGRAVGFLQRGQRSPGGDLREGASYSLVCRGDPRDTVQPATPGLGARPTVNPEPSWRLPGQLSRLYRFSMWGKLFGGFLCDEGDRSQSPVEPERPKDRANAERPREAAEPWGKRDGRSGARDHLSVHTNGTVVSGPIP